MRSHEIEIRHDAAARYERSRTLASKYIKDDYLQSEAWQWAVWFVYSGGQCGTPCPYWPDICLVGSEVCLECPGCEGVQIVTAHSGRVYCKNKKAEIKPLPECYFLPEGKNRLEQKSSPQLPTELCPW